MKNWRNWALPANPVFLFTFWQSYWPGENWLGQLPELAKPVVLFWVWFVNFQLGFNLYFAVGKLRLHVGHAFNWDKINPSIYMRGSRSIEKSNIVMKHIYYFFYPNFSNPCCSSPLSTRFGDVVGGLADPRATSLCPSPTGLPKRCSWVYRASNGRQIGPTNLLVCLAVLGRSRWV